MHVCPLFNFYKYSRIHSLNRYLALAESLALGFHSRPVLLYCLCNECNEELCFVYRHGTEPVLNLMYSDKGSTASRISMSVADEVNREHVASIAGPSSSQEGMCLVVLF